MVIKSRKELDFYIQADRIMNRGVQKYSLKRQIVNCFFPDYIMEYLECMRKYSYYKYRKSLFRFYYQNKYRKLGLKLGFSIGCDVFGYGLVIPHYGTIVVGNSNIIGNFSVLHTSICISDNGKEIGDGLYVATGSKITSKVNIGDNCSIGANSVVNKSFTNNLLIGGIPAKVIKDNYEAWYQRDGIECSRKVEKVESLKKNLNL